MAFQVGKRRFHVTLIEVMVFAAIVLIVFALIVGAMRQSDEKDRFMRACMEDHKEYECLVMWKEMQPDTQIIYVPGTN